MSLNYLRFLFLEGLIILSIHGEGTVKLLKIRDRIKMKEIFAKGELQILLF